MILKFIPEKFVPWNYRKLKFKYIQTHPHSQFAVLKSLLSVGYTLA
jgi:hypothetical protein